MLSTLNIPSPTGFVKDSNEAEEIKNFVSDYTYLSNTSRLQEVPILLKEDSNKLDSGKYYNSLHDLQEHSLYVTEHGNLVSRNQREVVITRKDRRARVSFPCQLVSPGTRKELRMLSTPGLLKATGIMLQEANHGKGLILFQLQDLPLGTVYTTELGATVFRKSATEVSYDKFIISIPVDDKAEVPQVLTVSRAPTNRPPIVDTSLLNPAITLHRTLRKSCTIGFHVIMKVVGGGKCRITLLLDPKVLLVIRKEQTLAAESHNRYTVLEDVKDSFQFTLIISQHTYRFVAPSPQKRSDILGMIRFFKGTTSS